VAKKLLKLYFFKFKEIHAIKNKGIVSKIGAKTCSFPAFETLKTVKN
jgi:hypothetical protein